MSTIVVYADGSAESERAVSWCARHADGSDKVVAVYGFHPVAEFIVDLPLFDPGETERALRAELEREWIRPLRDAGLTAGSVFVSESPARAVRAVATDVGADLIVVGKRPHGLLRDLVVNDVATALAHDPPCPMVIVPCPARRHHTTAREERHDSERT